MSIDLSRAAIAARAASKAHGAGTTGWTGSELIDMAGRNLEDAHRHMKIAGQRTRPARREVSLRKAREALLAATFQVMTAEQIPLARGYLHALTHQQVERVRAAVLKEAEPGDADAFAKLAVTTHTRIAAQRARRREEQ